MHSDDLVRWLITILLNSNKKPNTYNVGSDEAISIENLAKIISKKFNKKVNRKKNFLVKDKKEVVDYYVPSISKAKKDLNLKLRYKLNYSLKSLLGKI